MKKHLIIATGFMSLFGTSSLSGEIVTVNFVGIVDSVNDPVGDFPGVIVGDTVRGTYSYDTDSVDKTPLNEESGRYLSPIPPAKFAINVGPLSFQVGPAVTVGVGNFSEGPKDTLVIGGPIPDTVPDVGVILYFEDPTGTAYSDISLPVSPPDLTQFTTSWGGVSVMANSSSVGFEFTSIVLAPDPVPAVSSWGLAVVSLMMLTVGTVMFRRGGLLYSRLSRD